MFAWIPTLEYIVNIVKYYNWWNYWDLDKKLTLYFKWNRDVWIVFWFAKKYIYFRLELANNMLLDMTFFFFSWRQDDCTDAQF